MSDIPIPNTVGLVDALIDTRAVYTTYRDTGSLGDTWNHAWAIANSARWRYPGTFADGYCAALSDARSASGDRDTDPGTDRAEVDAFTDRAAHNIANVYASRAHAGTPIEAIADDYAFAYEVAVDRLRSLADGRGRSGPDRSRGRDGGAS